MSGFLNLLLSYIYGVLSLSLSCRGGYILYAYMIDDFAVSERIYKQYGGYFLHGHNIFIKTYIYICTHTYTYVCVFVCVCVSVCYENLKETFPIADYDKPKKAENLEHFNCFGSMITDGSRCTIGIKSNPGS